MDPTTVVTTQKQPDHFYSYPPVVEQHHVYDHATPYGVAHEYTGHEGQFFVPVAPKEQKKEKKEKSAGDS